MYRVRVKFENVTRFFEFELSVTAIRFAQEILEHQIGPGDVEVAVFVKKEENDERFSQE